jgi:heme O synthase-like polyprenyltransferase
MEKLYDKQMKRTEKRPLPKQRISDQTAWIVSGSLWAGSILAYYSSFPHAILFSNSILFLYILGYTPLKRVSNLSMHIGAVVGALPALLGSYAATGVLMLEPSLLLAAYIFLWQYPHFYGILYQNKDDYKKAGFKFISNSPERTKFAYLQMLLAMALMLYVVKRLYDLKVLNKITMLAFSYYYVLSLIPVVKFINNPSMYAKAIRTKSYTPFMIIILAFMAQAAKNTYKGTSTNAIADKQLTTSTISYLNNKF